MPFPPALFRQASNGNDDVDSQKSYHEYYSWYLDNACRGLQSALSIWRQQAGLVDVRIAGVLARGGRMQGPKLEPIFTDHLPTADPWHLKMSTAIARGVSECFDHWMNSVSVPGLPWYPNFAAYPGPKAPPTPNLPSPLAMLGQEFQHLKIWKLKDSMDRYMEGGVEYSGQVLESLAISLDAGFETWKRVQVVSEVMGGGLIPTYAPPYLPVGPVLDGTIEPGAHLKW